MVALMTRVVQSAVEVLLASKEPSQKAMLLMSVRETRDTLKLRLQESQGTSDSNGTGDAVGEAHALLKVIDEQFHY